jgi:phosphoglycerate kinase
MSSVLIRVDFNVPVQGDKITDSTRVLAVRKTVEYFHGHRIILISHFKDPKDGEIYSFAPILDELRRMLQHDVLLLDLFDEQLQHKVNNAPQDTLILLDNSRSWPGEKSCDDALSKRIASLGKIFINEAFSCAHRAHASVVGVAKYLPTYPGFHFQSELNALARALKSPEKPFVAIVGGSKISGKLPILQSLLPKVDFMAIGGAMAHTFLAALGRSLGQSLLEPEYVPIAKELLSSFPGKILLPIDVVVAKNLTSTPKSVDVSGIPSDCSAFDIGPRTANAWGTLCQSCKTVVWNGTLGVAEHPPFDEGSKIVAMHICESGVFSLAGGGDTLAALYQLGFSEKFSHVCTGGGAFLEWLGSGKLIAEETFTASNFNKILS